VLFLPPRQIDPDQQDIHLPTIPSSLPGRKPEPQIADSRSNPFPA
jgi:hypothetical protein